MTHYRFLVESRPLSGMEDEYHQWYDGRHSADLLTLPGARQVQRFRTIGSATDVPTFFMIVDYETDDLAGLLATIRTRAQSAGMPSSDALDPASVKVTILEARGPARRHPGETICR